MDNLRVEGVILLVALLPGFLCARLIQSFCVRPEQTELDKVTESLLYSFVVYVIFVVMCGSNFPLSVTVAAGNGIQRYDVSLHPKQMVELATIALLVAAFVGFSVTNDVSGRIFRVLRLTQRTSRGSVWSDTFHDLHGVVQVGLKDGRMIMGWLRFYSDEPAEQSVFLERAAWVNPANPGVGKD
ncbi:MAG: hypothetical protein H0X25_03445 [Acidobacteriales bacterium]|nr:hypothetical protein [Terriglobales bacterium]